MFLFSEFTCSSFQIIGIPMANSRAMCVSPLMRDAYTESDEGTAMVNVGGNFAGRRTSCIEEKEFIR